MANSGSKYQVFLNFCGKDTRRGFTNTLYHALVDAGVRVFLDKEEIPLGEEFSKELLQAIDDSKLYITIFSPNYASQHWCLRELAKMVEITYGPEEDGNKKVDNTSKHEEDGNKKVIFPIFYNVRPKDLKSNTGLYSEAISELEQRMENQKRKFSMEEVKKWRWALQKVDGTQGLKLEDYEGDGHLSESVVEDVLRKLQTRHREVTKDLVGMENRMEYINNLLHMESGDVRLIGVWGMGGIGKTTLAENIFNQLCPHFGKNCSFLANVRGTEQTKGLVELQKKLLSDISYPRGARTVDDIKDGIKAIEETIGSKKVLIVLDDVDDRKQIQNLIGMKSLNSGTRVIVTTRDKNVLNIRGFKYRIMPYEMEGLSNDDALKLFSKHAFNNDSPPPDYFTFSKDIVSTTGGLPLALQAIGASLFGLEDIDIWKEKLKELRKIPHDDVLGMLETTYKALNSGQQQIFLDIACFFIGKDGTNLDYMWEDCGFSPRSAIRVLINRCIIKILEGDRFWMHDQFRDLGRAIAEKEHTRIWDRHNITCATEWQANRSVQALHIESNVLKLDGPIYVTAQEIEQFPNLRFLCLAGIKCKGNFTGCLSKLKWITLRCRLEGPFMTTNLNLGNVVVMETRGDKWTEDTVRSLIEGAPKLKVFTLLGCPLLHRIPTFPERSVLEKLTISDCYSLKEIDCSIGKLGWLTYLRIEGCGELEELPEQIGKLRRLQHLSLRNCEKLRELPGSVSELELLTTLDVSRTGITGLPDSIGRLRNLSSLNVSWTRIVGLPETTSKLSQLHRLDLFPCGEFRELPELPGSLTTLRLRTSSLQTVPDLSNLTNLVELLLTDASSSSPYTKSNTVQPCQWVGRLSKLRKLDLGLLNVSAPPTEWASLILLEELSLSGLDLQTLKQFPSNLTALELDNIQVKQAELDGLPLLEELTIRSCGLITSVSIPSSLRKLRVVRVMFCDKLVQVQFLGVLRSMERLSMWKCQSFERLVCLSEEPGCNVLIDGRKSASLESSSLPMLQDLQMRDCSSLKRFGLSNLKNLKRLEFHSCESLQVVEGTDELERLERLTVYRCRSMERIVDASSSKIPNECRMEIRSSGQLVRSDPSGTWESYREKILNGTMQASDSETEAETEVLLLSVGPLRVYSMDDYDEKEEGERQRR